jgi:hypothetical protein
MCNNLIKCALNSVSRGKEERGKEERKERRKEGKKGGRKQEIEEKNKV